MKNILIMKKVVRLTESDLIRIVKRVINEGAGRYVGPEMLMEIFPEANDYGFTRKQIGGESGSGSITYNSGNEQIVFKYKLGGKQDNSDSIVYVGASGNFAPMILKKGGYLGKQFNLSDIEPVVDYMFQFVLTPYNSIVKDGYKLVNSVNLKDGQYKYEGSSNIVRIGNSNFYVMLGERIRGQVSGTATVSNGKVIVNEYGGVIATMTK